MKKVHRILVPLDHSPLSEDIVEYACVVARGVGASVTVMHLFEPPNAMIGMIAGATTAGEAKAEREAGVRLLDRAAAIFQANGLASPDRILESGSPVSEAIARHIRSGKFDLVVMGTHARRGISRAVLGSVAEEVVRSVTCPVLLVHLAG